LKKSLINWLGLLGPISFISYVAAVIFSPLAYPEYNWMTQAVSDLSAARLLAVWATVALSLMFAGVIGTGIVPQDYFGIPERFSVICRHRL